MVAKGEAGEGWTGTDVHTLLRIKEMANKDLLSRTGNPSQHAVVTYMGKESEKECIYTDAQLIHFAVYLKLT